jgi:competence protein ComEA
VTAQTIVDYRKKNPFKTVEDIKNVNGIGDSKYNRIKDYICV